MNSFPHWYTCCTVAHVFFVNIRGLSLKTDVKFNTCLTNTINVRFFVNRQFAFFNGLCFCYISRKQVWSYCYWHKTLLTQVLSKSRAPWKANWYNFVFWRIFFSLFFFSCYLQLLQSRVISPYVLEKPNLSMWFKHEKLR